MCVFLLEYLTDAFCEEVKEKECMDFAEENSLAADALRRQGHPVPDCI